MKVQINGAPHRKIHVIDMLPNPHRDLKLNPVNQEKIDALIDSFGRTGFWDNVVVREHPTLSGKYELAYGHNRLAALKDRRVEVSTVTIPVAKLNDWDMYCSMVDENETQQTITPAIVFENVGVGCTIIEAALKKIGEKGTWAQFNEALGRAVATATARLNNDHGFEQVREAYWRGEGIGRGFLAAFLPCGKLREHTISEVVGSRYGEQRATSMRKQAEEAESIAKEKEREAAAATGKKERARLEKEAEKERARAERLKKTAMSSSKSGVAQSILLQLETPRMMVDFGTTVRELNIPKAFHEEALKVVLDKEVKGKSLKRELTFWWDVKHAPRLRKLDSMEREALRLSKIFGGMDYTSYLLGIADGLKDLERRVRVAILHAGIVDKRGAKIVTGTIAPITELLAELVAVVESKRFEEDVTPKRSTLLTQ